MQLSRRGLGLGMAAIAATPTLAAPARYRVRRLVDRPIIAPGMHPRIGSNIQGPSAIRVPDWVPGRLGRYYLYFADHKGDHIRLAYADTVTGPWTIHGPGALGLEASGFPAKPPIAPATPLVRPALKGYAPAGTPGVPRAEDDATVPHIASPDVHVDVAQSRIRMYFHGLDGYGVQRSRVAVSFDGLTFTVLPSTIPAVYMRAFAHQGMTYALAMPGTFLRSRDGLSDFEAGPTLFAADQRHTALLRRGNILHIFWTRVGDAPERILATTVDISGDWRGWKASDPVDVLRPERPWEGANQPPGPSYRSGIDMPVNQLRDPAIFEDRGRTYLLYAVAGERGIGLAELTVT